LDESEILVSLTFKFGSALVQHLPLNIEQHELTGWDPAQDFRAEITRTWTNFEHPRSGRQMKAVNKATRRQYQIA